MSEDILIVDDSADSRSLLAVILKRVGYAVRQAPDGPTALEMVARAAPHLILLDVNMPGWDGFTVCARLKAHSAWAEIPVIFVSARDEAADKVRGLEIGGADYITKPFDKAEVLARVRSHLKISALTHELRQKNQELSRKQADLEEDLRAAAAIQASLLPQKLPNTPQVELSWEFVPCQTLGGDIFHALELDEGWLGLYILDVSGHGVPSSLVTVSIHETLLPHSGVVVREAAEDGRPLSLASPLQVARELDRLYPLERFEKTFSIVYAVLDMSSGRFSYVNAGHPPPLLLRVDGGRELLRSTGPLIGLDGMLPFEEAQCQLRPGDRILLYTDGVTDLQDRDGGFLGEGPFLEFVEQVRRLPLAAGLRGLRQMMADYAGGAAPQDDISLLGLAYWGDARR